MVGGGGKAREHGRTCSVRIMQCVRGLRGGGSGVLSLFFLFLTGLFTHYQGHPDGSVHILRLVVVILNTELDSRPFLHMILFHRFDVTQQSDNEIILNDVLRNQSAAQLKYCVRTGLARLKQIKNLS